MSFRMGYPFAAFMGVVLGAIHGAILWGAMLMFTSAYVKHNVVCWLSLTIACIVDIFSLAIVLSSRWWLPRMMSIRDEFVTAMSERDDAE